jgi:opacity protein-like surface antigen
MKTILCVAVSVLFALYATAAAAQVSGPRAGRWEFTLSPQYVDSKTVTGGNGSSADISGDWGFGFGLAYNFNNHFALGGEFTWNEASYRARVAPAAGNPGAPFNISGTLETTTLRMNGTWNFLTGNFTPFVTGGIGSTWVDTNIPNGPPATVCWWDPWWGEYCGPVVPTKSDTYFSYNAGAGVRWEVNRGFFMSAAYIRQWVDVGGPIGSPGMDQFRISFGFKY